MFSKRVRESRGCLWGPVLILSGGYGVAKEESVGWRRGLFFCLLVDSEPGKKTKGKVSDRNLWNGNVMME